MDKTISPEPVFTSVRDKKCCHVLRIFVSQTFHQNPIGINTIAIVSSWESFAINVMEDTILASFFLRYFVFIEERYAFLSNEARNKGSFFLDVFRVERKIKKGVPTPLCDIYKDMVDSYIIELKYCKSQTTDEQVKKLFEEASAQISRNADSDMVREAVKTTKLHKLVVIYRGAEMVACEEI